MLASSEQLLAIDPSSLDYARDKARPWTMLAIHIAREELSKGDRIRPAWTGEYDEILKQDPQNARAKKDVGDCSHHVSETLLASSDTAARYCCCCEPWPARELVAWTKQRGIS